MLKNINPNIVRVSSSSAAEWQFTYETIDYISACYSNVCLNSFFIKEAFSYSEFWKNPWHWGLVRRGLRLDLRYLFGDWLRVLKPGLRKAVICHMALSYGWPILKSRPYDKSKTGIVYGHYYCHTSLWIYFAVSWSQKVLW